MHHGGHHRVAPHRGVVAQQDHGPAVGGDLHRPGDHPPRRHRPAPAVRAARRPARRTPMRSLAAPTSHGATARRSAASASSASGPAITRRHGPRRSRLRAGPGAAHDRPRGRVGGRCRARPRSRSAPGPETGEHVRGPAAEHRGDVEPARHGEVTPQIVEGRLPPPAPGPGTRGPRCRARRAGRRRVTSARPTTATWAGPAKRRRGPERGDLDDAGAVVVAHQPVGGPQAEKGSAAPARGTPRRGHAHSAQVLHHRQQPRGHRPRRVRGAVATAAATRCASAPADRVRAPRRRAAGRCRRGCSAVKGGGVGVEEREPGASQELPPARGGLGVDAGEPASDGHGSRRRPRCAASTAGAPPPAAAGRPSR